MSQTNVKVGDLIAHGDTKGFIVETNQKKQFSYEQVKEIIKSYPKEDLYELLNYDQKTYISDEEQKKSISNDARDRLIDKHSGRVVNCDDLDTISGRVAYLWISQRKDDTNLSYWENMDAIIEMVFEEKGI